MTTFEKCIAIRRVIINRSAEVMCYSTWSDEFAVKSIREIPAMLLEQSPELLSVQPCELTNSECDSLEFGRWEEGNPMRLIPLWLLPFLAEEINVSCIDGGVVYGKSQMDDDHRYGSLAYGIVPCDATFPETTVGGA